MILEVDAGVALKWFLNVRDGEPDRDRALALFIRHRHHLFDTLYHAVALRVPDASFITADRRYYEKVGGEGRMILLADWLPD